ncbi:MAG: 2-phosphosulfolactate phosphatase [Candidatus Brocadiales bacterium]
MEINLSFTPSELQKTGQVGKRVVVIDVLRACSTMIYALSQGCKAIYPCATVSEARGLLKRKVKSLGKDRVLLGGERGGVRVRGFHLGNSPKEYSYNVVRNKTIVFTTTNCTRNLMALKGPKEVIICSFVNLPVVAEHLSGEDADVLLALSGTDGQTSLEDAVCGGMLIHMLSRKYKVSLSDSARSACILYRHYRRKIRRALLDSSHGRRLLELGFKNDIYFCAEVGQYKIIPRFVRGRVTLSRA